MLRDLTPKVVNLDFTLYNVGHLKQIRSAQLYGAK